MHVSASFHAALDRLSPSNLRFLETSSTECAYPLDRCLNRAEDRSILLKKALILINVLHQINLRVQIFNGVPAESI